MPSLSRRQLLIGAGAVVAGGAGWFGRFAVGDVFEDHVGARLGLDVRTTGELLAALRDDLGAAEYDVRAAGFLAATTLPSRLVMPGPARREAVESFIGPLVGLESGLVTPYVLAGMQDSGRQLICGGRARA